ncbi:hypothetical protein J3E69DRAFT_329397 [Trichoderma sp. SZMC 28015]
MFLLFLTRFIRSLAPILFVLYGTVGKILRTYLTRVPSARNPSSLVPLSSYCPSNKAISNTNTNTCRDMLCRGLWRSLATKKCGNLGQRVPLVRSRSGLAIHGHGLEGTQPA